MQVGARASSSRRFPHNRGMPHHPFNLTRWFALLGLVTIASLSIASAMSLSRYLTDRMLRQEAVLTMEFINSVLVVDNATDYFRDRQKDPREVTAIFNHIAGLPDVIRASAHSAERRVVWSSDKAIVGRQFFDNPELVEALAGELVVMGNVKNEHTSGDKSEHASLNQEIGYFVEIYFPVRDPAGHIVGAVELYKKPRALYEAINTGRQAIWAGAVLGGLFLYGALFWLTRRADNLIREQQERLVQNETLSAMGEMSSAVAHGIRNPLASIRSSAELALEFSSPDAAEPARDIIAEVDRMENWVRELLSYARPEAAQTQRVDLAEMVTHILTDFERETARRGIVTEFHAPENLPQVHGDHLLLGQVVSSLISNAVEAMVVGGHIALSAEQTRDQVLLRVRDDGPGVSAEQMPRVFKPFFTTKPKGLGVGLAQAKRVVERFGGTIDFFSEPGRGVTVEVRLRIAEGSR